MSYCVNCGVELKDTEKRCPLCDTVVINPRTFGVQRTDDEPKKEYERINTVHIDYRLLATIISVILIIPIALTFISDAINNNAVTWSVYVCASCLLFFITVLMPAYFKNKSPYKFIFADAVAVFLFLWFICVKTGGNWAFSVGLPMCVITTALVLLCTMAIRSRKISKLLVTSIIIVMSGLYTLCVEIVLIDAFKRPFVLQWSHFVIIPCAAVGIVLLIIDSQKKLKEELRKKLFM